MARPADGFSRLEPLLAGVERPARYIDGEWGARHGDGSGYRAVLVYPDTYELGMANQAIAVLYERLNAVEGVTAERAFAPWKDLGAQMRAGGVALASLESSTPLVDCDLVGVTLPYELTFPTVLEVLDLAGIPLRAADRDGTHPLVVSGGPAAYDPEPMAPFFDAVFIGEAEHAAPELVAVHRRCRDEGLDRHATLVCLAEEISGLYVPALYEGSATGARPLDPRAPASIPRRVLTGFPDEPSVACPVVPYMDVVHDRSVIEITRGCTRGCRFCQAGIVYRPVRERPADAVVRDVMRSLGCTGYDEVALTSLSSADHSQIEEILRRLKARLAERAVSVSLPSLRVDAFSVGLARLASAGKRSGLTFAPEAGSQRLRDVINKNVTENDLLSTVEHAFEAGWRRVKLYFMIGLPTETDDDVAEIGALVGRVLGTARAAAGPAAAGSVRIAVSVTTFVPKAHTPFQWEPQLSREQIEHRQRVLRESMPRRGVELSYHDPATSLIEGALARGDREIADVIESVWRGGGAFSAWTDEFDAALWNASFEAAGLPVPDGGSPGMAGSPTPWEHVSSGVTRDFLVRERDKALRGEPTYDCASGPCSACGVCGGDVAVVTSEPRR